MDKNPKVTAPQHTPTPERHYFIGKMFQPSCPYFALHLEREDVVPFGFVFHRTDAEFVAKTLNEAESMRESHAALVDALRELVAQGETANRAFYVTGTRNAMVVAMAGQKSLLDQARAALALAERSAAK